MVAARWIFSMRNLKNSTIVAGDDINVYLRFDAVDENSIVGTEIEFLIDSISGDNFAQYSTQSGSVVKQSETARSIVATVAVPKNLTTLSSRDRNYRFYARLTMPDGKIVTPSGAIGGFKILANPNIDIETTTGEPVVVEPPPPTPTPTGKSYFKTFTQSDLSIAGLLPVVHEFGESPKTIRVLDDQEDSVEPDYISDDTPDLTVISFESAMPIDGTWQAILGA